MPSRMTAFHGSRLPIQDSTTTATPMASVTALKITEMISRIDFFSISYFSLNHSVFRLIPAYTLYFTSVFRLHIGTFCMRMCLFYRCCDCFLTRMYIMTANQQRQMPAAPEQAGNQQRNRQKNHPRCKQHNQQSRNSDCKQNPPFGIPQAAFNAKCTSLTVNTRMPITNRVIIGIPFSFHATCRSVGCGA